MDLILDKLRMQTTRDSTARNYYNIWCLFNKFIIKLDKKPSNWKRCLTLYGAFLVDQGIQSSILKSYFSAIKKILSSNGFELKFDQLLLNSLAKACRLINDRVHTRLPIQSGLLKMLLFEIQRVYKNQFYLETMYKALFILAYYDLLRIGKLTASPHIAKAKDIRIGLNKNKILIILHTSKMHGLGSKPQKIKISEGNSCIENKVRCKKRFFCPFDTVRNYLKIRGCYKDENEQFFIFRDGSPVSVQHA